MFLNVLAATAEEQCGLIKDRPLVVGVSGGADSLALMLGLQALGYDLVVVHLDHGLRTESAADADYVAELAAARGLRCVRNRVAVGQGLAEGGGSLEEVAREARYRFLFDLARREGAQAVAVGHHADDQVETVLMHFLRGAALPGLSGMPYRRRLPAWDEHIPLVRPLLGMRREEIESFVATQGVDVREDLSNRDTTYFRNRLRHELIPELETYNPGFRQVVWRMADVLGEEDRYLDELTDEAWMACQKAEGDGRVEIYLCIFRELPRALRRRVLRRAIACLRPNLRDVGFEAIERGLAFAAEPTERGEIDLAARLNLAVVGEVLIVKTWEVALPEWDQPLLLAEGVQAVLDIEHPVQLAHGWRLTAEVVEEAVEDIPGKFARMDPNQAWLDLDTLSLPLSVRGRRPGEGWQPLGMDGHTQSLSDFFINQKIPAHWRDRWPLVCSGEMVAWVARMRPSEAFKVRKNTQRFLHLQLQQSRE